jgi:outer membrane immunogenic protein
MIFCGVTGTTASAFNGLGALSYQFLSSLGRPMNMSKAKSYLLTGTAGIAIAPLMGMALAPAANAADMRLKAPPAPPPVAAPSWTGCYIGVNVGGASQRSQFNEPEESDFAVISGDNSAGSLIGGGQIGCNYQTGTFVFGLEGDYSGLSKPSGLYFSIPGDTNSYGSHISWMATVRGRVGVTFGDGSNLLYATGGAAFTHVNASALVAPSSFDYSASRTGWVVGGGYEKMLTPHVIIGVEGLFADFGNFNSAGSKCCAAVHNTVGIARGRLSFKF